MADVLTADQVAQVVSFIAPGFVARIAYAGRFQRREPQQFSLLVSSVVLSLPLVAAATALARWLGVSYTKVTDLGYVLLLFGLSFAVGWSAALLRARRPVRQVLARLGLSYQPEGSIYAQTLLALPPEAVVTVECSDGRKISGTPRIGPGPADGGIAELYLTNPAWWDRARGRWVTEGAGGAVIVPLANVHSVTLDRDAT